MKPPKCLHCRKKKANRPRGLCWGCFRVLDIRKQYEPRGFFGRCGAKGHQMTAGAKS